MYSSKGSSLEGFMGISIATPANRTDPDLVEWVKSPANPILTGQGLKIFHDPTNVWFSKGLWRMGVRERWLATEWNASSWSRFPP